MRNIKKCIVYKHVSHVQEFPCVHQKWCVVSHNHVKHKFRKNTILVASHTTECLRSVWNSYNKMIEEHSHATSHKIRSFLLKTDRDTHRLNNWWQCRSSHQQAYHYSDVMYQNSNWGHSEGKHKRSKKDKNSYTDYYCIHINTDVFIQHTTTSVVFFKKDYKIHTIP